MKSGLPQNVNAFMHHKEGHRLPVKIKSIPMSDDSGEIIGGIEVFSDISEEINLEDKVEKLEGLVWKDELTGVANRRFITDKTKILLNLKRTFNKGFAIMFFDVDHFKRVNDTHSHSVGDKVLKMVANTLKNNLRSSDLIGRWGGEEFVGLFPGEDKAVFKEVANRIRMLIENSFLTVEDEKISVTVSIGVTIAKKGDTIDDLIKRADKMMYKCKTAGRNRVKTDF